jgi:hypothetical protein
MQEIALVDHHTDPLVICFFKKTMKCASAYIKARGNVVLGVDRTFDLSKYFVTTLTVSFDNFINPANKTSPTLSLASMFHTKATTKYYTRFFQKVKEALEEALLKTDENGLAFETTGPEEDLYNLNDTTDLAKYAIGSDQEAAIQKAAKSVFPNAKHVLCTLHLKKNF